MAFCFKQQVATHVHTSCSPFEGEVLLLSENEMHGSKNELKLLLSSIRCLPVIMKPQRTQRFPPDSCTKEGKKYSLIAFQNGSSPLLSGIQKKGSELSVSHSACGLV